MRSLAIDFAEEAAKRVAAEKEKPAATRLRSALLVLYERFLIWMRKADLDGTDPAELLKGEDFQALAEVMQNIVSMIRLLNRPEDGDAKSLRDFESFLPTLQEMIPALFQKLDSPALPKPGKGGGKRKNGTRSLKLVPTGKEAPANGRKPTKPRSSR